MARRLATALAAAALCLAPGRASFAGDPPKIRSVLPANAPRGSQAEVTIEGSNLSAVTDVLTNRADVGIVKLGGGTDHRLVLRVTIPDGAEPGPLKITLKSANGNVDTEKFTIRLRAPVPAKVKPDVLRRGAEYDLTLPGVNLEIGTAETKVTVDAPMTVKNMPASTEKGLLLHLVVPAATPAGAHALVLETVDGKASVPFTVVLSPPGVMGLEPTKVARGAKATLKVRGNNLAGTTGAVLAIPDPSVTLAISGAPSDESVSLEVGVAAGAKPGPRLVVLLTPDGAAAESFDVVTKPPTKAKATPAGAVRGTTGTVRVEGENVPPDADVRVVPPDAAITIDAPRGGVRQVVVAPEAVPGPRALAVSTAEGATLVPFDVTSRVPAVTAITPTEVPAGADTDVTFEGHDLEGGAWSVVPADPDVSVAPSGPDHLKVSVKAGAKPGPRTLVLRTAEGASTGVVAVAGAAPLAPSLKSTTPPRVSRRAPGEVAIAGLNLGTGPGGAAAPVLEAVGPGGAKLALETVAVGSTEVRVRVKADASTPTGAYVVALTTAEGGVATVVTVDARPPAVASVTPPALPRGPDAQVTLAGSFLAEADGKPPTVTVTAIDGTASVACAVVSASDDKVVLGLSGLANAPAGPRVIVVRTADGAAAALLAIDAVPPVIAGVSPASIGVPASVDVKVAGQRLLRSDGGKPTAVVTRVGSGSGLGATVTSADAKAVVVRVTTPTGTPPGPHVLVLKTPDGDVAALLRVVDAPPPQIAKIDATSGLRGTATTTLIHGKGLTGTSEVVVSGEGITVTLLPGGTDTDLPVRFAIAANAAPGPRSFRILGPGGEATSEEGAFTVK
jgi:hypothetical protein